MSNENNLNIWLVVILLILFFVFGFAVDRLTKPKTIVTVDKIIKEIDTLYQDRILYKHDTVFVKVKNIVEKTNTQVITIEKLFKDGDDTTKINLFNKYYPSIDTNYLMRITDFQAKTAIIEKENHIRDSSLMEVYKKSADDCDIRLTTIKNKADDIPKLVQANLDSVNREGIKKGVMWTSIAAGIAAVYILLTK